MLLLCSLGLNVLKSWILDTEGMVHDDIHRPGHPPPWNSQVYLEPEQEDRYPIVLWWLPYSQSPRVIKRCKHGSCLFTHSRTEVNNSLTKGIIFYGTGLQWNDMPLPRHPSQTWSLLHEESPKNAWSLTTPEVISLFNHTATSSRFSSLPLTTLSLNSMKRLLAPSKTPSYMKSINGYGLVMYLHSDCDVPSDRDSYVFELMKYIPVDSYGKCLHNSELPEHLRDPSRQNIDSKEIINLMSKYKFVLTFENVICDDYITEKLWRIFEAGSVPVYKGSPSVEDWTPNDHSIISVDEFTSPAHLAHYLLLLNDNQEEYNTYFEYKNEGITNKRLLEHMKNRNWALDDNTRRLPNFVQAFECHICDSIHKREQKLRKGVPVKPIVADGSHYRCPALKPSVQLTSNSDLQNYRGREMMDSWKRIIECEKMTGKAVAQEISRGAGRERISEVLHSVAKKCDSLQISQEWMLNQYSLEDTVHGPVGSMCTD